MTCPLCNEAHSLAQCKRWRLKAVAVIPLALLAGCSSFNLGGIAYCPHGQACAFSVQPPPPAASAAP